VRGVAVDLLAAARKLGMAKSVDERRWAQAQIRRAAPPGWTQWMVMLLPKPGKPLDVVAKRRDIYLQPHGLKLLMNGFKPEYDRVARGVQPAANSGFRKARDAPEVALAMALAREEAYSENRGLCRGYADKAGYFQSIVRRMQQAVERRAGVAPEVTTCVMALQEATEVRMDSGEGLAHGADSEIGVGQGDTDGPTRSMEPLAIETRAIELLVVGFKFTQPRGVARTRMVQLLFADDGSKTTGGPWEMQVGYTVMSVI
jgi:hypothetical protein